MLIREKDLKMETVWLRHFVRVADQMKEISEFWGITIISYHKIGHKKYAITYVDNDVEALPYDANWGMN